MVSCSVASACNIENELNCVDSMFSFVSIGLTSCFVSEKQEREKKEEKKKKKIQAKSEDAKMRRSNTSKKKAKQNCGTVLHPPPNNL